MFSTKLVQNVMLGIVVAIFVGSVLWAGFAGVHAGQSNTILKNVASLNQGLNYFFADQDRYPSTVEFADRNLMLSYFNPFPPVSIASGSCAQTYQYANPSAKTFELDFCLPKAAQGFKAGWNAVTSKE